MLLDFGDDVDGIAAVPRRGGDADRVVDRRQLAAGELHVDHGADDLNDFAGVLGFCCFYRCRHI
jgi:hypothetical protein